MPTADGLPVLVFDDASIPVEHQFEVFHDTTAPIFDTAPVEDRSPFRATAVDYFVEDIVVSRLRYAPQTIRRSARHVRSGFGDNVAIQLYHRGGLRGAIGDDDDLSLGGASIGVVDMAQPFSAIAGHSDVTWVGIPKHRLTAGARRTSGLQTWDIAAPRGRVLSAFVRDLWAGLGAARADDAPALADGIIETLSSVLDPRATAPPDQGVLPAMKEYIAVHLDDFTLGPETLMAVFHYSRSSVYRLFEGDGGIARYIRDQRLLRCFDDLTRPARLPRRVSHVALRWGFENPSHFNRIFKAKFGMPPSEVRALPVLRPRDNRPTGADVLVQAFHARVAAVAAG